MWDLSLDDLLILGFIGNKAYNICSKAGLKSIHSINEYSKVHYFSEIESCGVTTETLLLSLCESYRRALERLANSCDTTNTLTFETSLDYLLEIKNVSRLAYNVCSSFNIVCVGDIIKKINSSDVINRCALDIRQELLLIYKEVEVNRLQLSLKESPNIIISKQNPVVLPINNLENQLYKDIPIEKLYNLGLLSKRAYHCCKRAGLYTLRNISDFRDKGTEHLYTLQNCGIKTVEELCRLCIRYKSLPNDNCESTLSQTFEKFPIDDVIKLEHSDAAKEFFNLEFESLKDMLSVRGRHLCEATWSTYEDMIPFFDCSFESFSKRFAGKKKSSKELFDFLERFKSIYLLHENCSEEEFLKLKNENLFPFLIERELDFAVTFRNKYGRYPMLYILTAYLSLSSDRLDSLYSYKFGISSGIARSNNEVAVAYHMTAERVRQIIQGYCLDTTLKFVSMPDWKYYIINAPLVLTEASPIYKELSEQEDLQNGFSAFVGLLGLVVGYSKVRRKGERIYVKKEYEAKARNILGRLTELIEAKYSRDTRFTISSVVGDDDVSVSIARLLLTELFDIIIDENNVFEIKQGRVDVSMEIMEILDAIGSPMTLEEIFMFFKDKYPEHKYENPSQLRASINLSDEIVSISKSGIYGLKKWNLFTGSVRDCAYKILQSEEEPMPDIQLVEQLLQYFPNSNYKSLMSSLMSDSKDRFIHYVDSTIWLTEKAHLTSKVQVKYRMSFENRLADLKKFLFDYKRWPFISGGDDEASLARWIYNHTRSNILSGYDPEKAKQIEKLQEQYSNYSHNNSEYEFQNLCLDFRMFLEKNFRLPEENSENEHESNLAVWFYKILSKKEPYEDNRQIYFNQLLEYLYGFGFTFGDRH